MLIPIILTIIILLSGVFINTNKNATKNATKIVDDNNSILIFRIVFPVVIILSFVFCYLNIGSFCNLSKFQIIIGVLLFVIGILLRWRAINSLQQQFTVKITIINNHQLNTQGVYKYIRHPSYTGLIIYYLGLGLTMQNWCSILILIIPIFWVIHYRINLEENVLEKHFKEKYYLYKQSSKKLLPFVY
jgi:protein-S-isoprenylcysteine O-methyltransferase